MYRKCLTVVAGLAAAAAFARCPAPALAQHRGGGGGHGGGGYHGGGGRGGGYHGGYGGRGYGGGYGGRGYGYGGRGYGRGDWDGGGWGWGGFGTGLGLGLALDRGYGGWGGYGGYGGYGYGSPYYYGDSGVYYDTYPYRTYSPDTYDYGVPAYGDLSSAPSYYGGPAAAPDNSATVRVRVPADAKVWFGDTPTQQTGAMRTFQSPPLTPGKAFSYDIKAQWRDADGKEVTKTRQVDVSANGVATVDFTR